MLRSSRRVFVARSSLSSSALGAAGTNKKPHLFAYERAVAVSPGQMFSKDLIVAPQSDHPLDATPSQPARRWMRSSSETCVSTVQKSASLLTSYEINYKFTDPQWHPMLSLPCGNPVSLELRARHINFALKHLVQKGHGFYVVRRTDHSVLHPRGLAVVSHVVCSLDVKSERLLTQITHEGPLDASDPDGPWGVVATSDARSLAQAFQRKEMLWQRSRRIGSVQAQMGTFDWTQHLPENVGRASPEEVLLLEKDTKFFGQGMTCRGIVSSVNMAKHPFHFVNEFEAPVTCGVDAFQQAMHLSARKHKLLLPNEALHTVAWNTRQYYPYNPIELDLPFLVTVGSPMVYRGDDLKLVPPPTVGAPYLTASAESGITKNKKRNNKNKNKNKSNFCLIQFDVSFKQGASEYLYDQGNSYKAPKYWTQKNALPYECTFWCVRDGNVDSAHVEEIQPTFERMRSRLHSGGSSSSSTDTSKQNVEDEDDEEEFIDHHDNHSNNNNNNVDHDDAEQVDDSEEKAVRSAERAVATQLSGVVDYTSLREHTTVKDGTTAAATLAKLSDRKSFDAVASSKKKKEKTSGVLPSWDEPTNKAVSRKQRAEAALKRIHKKKSTTTSSSSKKK